MSERNRQSAAGVFDWKDLAAGGVAALLSFAVYFWTTAPNVTLLDSGEFITAGRSFGVPHPTGYPLWTILAWLIHLLPFGNDAWKINLLSGICGALAVGLVAALCRSSLRWMLPEAVGRSAGLSTIAALTGAWLFAFSQSMWSQAVIAEIYTLHALLVGLMLAATYAWMRRPHSLPLLLSIFFFLSLAFSNHQLTLALAPLPFFAVLIVRRRIFWDLVVAAVLTAELFYLALAVLSQDPLVLKAAMRTFYLVAALTAIYVVARKNRVRWRLIALLPVAVALGLLPYAYMPFASSTNPPMNWGYTRDAKGFFYSFNRSQYSGNLTDQSLRVLGPLVGVPRKKAPVPPGPPAPSTQATTSSIAHLKNWAGFFFWQLVRNFTPLSVLALVAAFGLLIYLPDSRYRAWLIILFSAFVLAAFLQPLLDKAGTDASGWWLQMPYHTYTNLIYGILCGTGLFVCSVLLLTYFPRVRNGLFLLLLLPVVPLVANYAGASQRDHWFGWQFGHDMLKDLPKGSVVIGGTDPGRFVSTYMIFGESPQPGGTKRDPGFDRRDLYIITQNALGDPFYMQYLQDHYSSGRPPVKSNFERWLGREHDYPDRFLVLPTPRDVEQAVISAATPDRLTGKRLEAVDGLLGFSAVLHWIWSRNRDAHDFFVEESFPLEWTYDYAIPHGLLYRMNKTKLEKLPDEAVKNDFHFWDDYKKRLLEDPNFRADFDARRSFSKLRSTAGNIYKHWKLFPEAERAYKEALDLWPCEGGSLNALMLLQWDRGEFDEILKYLGRAMEEDPNAAAWREMLGYAHKRKELHGAMCSLEATLESQPKNREARKELIALYRQTGQTNKAGEYLDNGIITHWDDPDFLRFAIAYHQLGSKPHDSIATARRLVEIEPAFYENFYLLARAWYSQTNTPEFYSAAAKAIALGGAAARERILHDPCFRPLTKEPEFKKLMEPASTGSH